MGGFLLQDQVSVVVKTVMWQNIKRCPFKLSLQLIMDSEPANTLTSGLPASQAADAISCSLSRERKKKKSSSPSTKRGGRSSSSRSSKSQRHPSQEVKNIVAAAVLSAVKEEADESHPAESKPFGQSQRRRSQRRRYRHSRSQSPIGGSPDLGCFGLLKKISCSLQCGGTTCSVKETLSPSSSSASCSNSPLSTGSPTPALVSGPPSRTAFPKRRKQQRGQKRRQSVDSCSLSHDLVDEASSSPSTLASKKKKCASVM